jgi:hypothetical protein
METLRLKLERKEIDVVLESDDGQETKYKLKELSGAERNKYLNKMTCRVKVGADGKAAGIKTFDGFQADLLGICLFNENDEVVSKESIENLPSSTQQILFEKAQSLSGLDNAEGTEKNE